MLVEPQQNNDTNNKWRSVENTPRSISFLIHSSLIIDRRHPYMPDIFSIKIHALFPEILTKNLKKVRENFMICPFLWICTKS